MNYDDMDYLFEPTTGTQGPILKRALALAKSQIPTETRKLIPQLYINNLTALIDTLNAGGYKAKIAIVDDSESVRDAFKKLLDENRTDFDISEICNALDKIVSQKGQNGVYKNGNYVNGNFDCIIINEAIETITTKLNEYHEKIVEKTTSENRNIDAPLYYDFKHLMSSCFDFAIKESAVGQDKMNEYISTLKLRMQSFVDDIRLSGPLMGHLQTSVA